MKSYKIEAPAKIRGIAVPYVSLLAQGKVGECLIRNGATQANFANFLAAYAVKAVAAGHTQEQLADSLRAIGAGNASQVFQALADLTIILDGGKPQSLSAYWASGNVKPDTSKVAIF